jgi:hypothetical protein
MKTQVFLRKIVWILALLATLLAFAGLDWLPVLKELNRLKRAERDYSLKTDNFRFLISNFVFPEEREKLIFSKTADRLLESLPMVADDASWLAMTVSALRDRAKMDQLDSALLLSQSAPGRPVVVPLNLSARALTEDLQRWLNGQRQETENCLRTFADLSQFPWNAVFGGPEFGGGRKLACRPIGIAVAAKLPALLKFVNHCTWLAGRLEIVQLRMSQGETGPLAMIICRGYYLVSGPSAWPVPAQIGGIAENLLIDADSELLWQPVDTNVVGLAQKKELPRLRDAGLFMRKKN